MLQVPDKDKPARYYPQGIDSAGKCFVIAYPCKPDPSGLCYFHKKLADGLFDKVYKPKQYGIEGGKPNV